MSGTCPVYLVAFRICAQRDRPKRPRTEMPRLHDAQKCGSLIAEDTASGGATNVLVQLERKGARRSHAGRPHMGGAGRTGRGPTKGGCAGFLIEPGWMGWG